jgi:hypothetical protein
MVPAYRWTRLIGAHFYLQTSGNTIRCRRVPKIATINEYFNPPGILAGPWGIDRDAKAEENHVHRKQAKIAKSVQNGQFDNFHYQALKKSSEMLLGDLLLGGKPVCWSGARLDSF